nr:uncharacterized protein LOC127332908 [Lolium perenne]
MDRAAVRALGQYRHFFFSTKSAKSKCKWGKGSRPPAGEPEILLTTAGREKRQTVGEVHEIRGWTGGRAGAAAAWGCRGAELVRGRPEMRQGRGGAGEAMADPERAGQGRGGVGIRAGGGEGSRRGDDGAGVRDGGAGVGRPGRRSSRSAMAAPERAGQGQGGVGIRAGVGEGSRRGDGGAGVGDGGAGVGRPGRRSRGFARASEAERSERVGQGERAMVVSNTEQYRGLTL